jgi:O-methyltransferase involved in polyketide biosynthesis
MAVQRPSTWTALRCREALFQRFLGAANEEEAAEVVRIACGVNSRAEIDRNADAQRIWHDVIRKPYLQFQQDPENQPQDQEK